MLQRDRTYMKIRVFHNPPPSLFCKRVFRSTREAKNLHAVKLSFFLDETNFSSKME